MKKHNCVFGMCVCVCVCVCFKADKWAPGWNWRRKLYVLSNQVGSIFFKIFTKVSLTCVVWNLKTGKRGFLNSVFKHPKMSNVTQILQKKTLLPNALLFFRTTVFNVWTLKLLFGITYQTSLKLQNAKRKKKN